MFSVFRETNNVANGLAHYVSISTNVCIWLDEDSSIMLLFRIFNEDDNVV